MDPDRGERLCTLRFATDPIPLVVTAVLVIVVAIARTRQDVPRLRLGSSAALAALVMLAPALSLATAPPAIIASHPGPRLMSYNVHRGYSNANIVAVDDIASAIRAESPDLVALVEVPAAHRRSTTSTGSRSCRACPSMRRTS